MYHFGDCLSCFHGVFFFIYIVDTIGIILKWRNSLKFYFNLKIVNFDCFDYFSVFVCSKCTKSVAIDTKRRFASVLKFGAACIGSSHWLGFDYFNRHNKFHHLVNQSFLRFLLHRVWNVFHTWSGGFHFFYLFKK